MRLFVAALAACLVAPVASLVAPAARAGDYSAALNDGATPARHVLVQQPAQGARTSLMVVSADPAGSPSSWCAFRPGIVPAPGVAGSFEIVAGASGFDRELPATIPQEPLACAPLPNQTSNITVLATQ